MNSRARITAIDPAPGAFRADAAYEVFAIVLPSTHKPDETWFLSADDDGAFQYVRADQCALSRAGTPRAHR